MSIALNPLRISFVNLKHTNHSCNGIGLGVAQVAAMAIKKLEAQIEPAIFQLPEDYIPYLEEEIPRIACFSNYIWNFELTSEICRRIKQRSPDTIIILGGPNYPVEREGQKEFLKSYPEFDFYIFREGELAFIELFYKLKEFDFNVSKVKASHLKIPNTHYHVGGEFVFGDLMPALKTLDVIPSPYLTGLCDKLLGQGLMPVLETKRGCPFKCTFCESGHDHYNRINSFSLDRAKKEVEYLSKHSTCPILQLADLNFGMYLDDVEVCKEIARVQGIYGWPKRFYGIAGKNKKDRVLLSASLVEGSYVSAAVQSTDEDSLKSIKRDNISTDQLIQVAQGRESFDSSSYSELILCLPEGTKESHFQSIRQLIDAGIGVVRSHQFIMLPGAESSSKETRRKFNLETRFRVTPGTMGSYQVFGETFFVPEIDEICVANDTTSFEDYLECRLMDLTVEIFYNNGVLRELFKFLRAYKGLVSELIFRIHNEVRKPKGVLWPIYQGFLNETQELWNKKDEVEKFLKQPGVIERYQRGELGNNEQLMYRGLVLCNHMEELHQIAFDAAKKLIQEKVGASVQTQEYNYLNELAQYSLLRKKDLMAIDQPFKKLFHYDFFSLAAVDFNENPQNYYEPKGISLTLKHDKNQQNVISKLLKVHGSSKYGMGAILSAGLDEFFREVSRA